MTTETQSHTRNTAAAVTTPTQAMIDGRHAESTRRRQRAS
jgi:hypothetical protein